MKRYLAIIIACICIAWAGMHYNQGKSRELIQSPNSTTENYGNDSIAFSDSSLEKAIREKISKPSGQIYKVDLENITELEVVSANIKELSGIWKSNQFRRIRLIIQWYQRYKQYK